MKLFDLYYNGSVLIRQRQMGFISAMKRKLSKEAQYKGCRFEIKYNSTSK